MKIKKRNKISFKISSLILIVFFLSCSNNNTIQKKQVKDTINNKQKQIKIVKDTIKVTDNNNFSLKLSGSAYYKNINMLLYSNEGILRGNFIYEDIDEEFYSYKILGYIDAEKDSVFLFAYSFTGEEDCLYPVPEKKNLLKFARDLQTGEWISYTDTLKINIDSVTPYKEKIYTPINQPLNDTYEQVSAHCTAYVKINKKLQKKYSVNMYDECILEYGDSTYYKDFVTAYNQETNSFYMKDVPTMFFSGAEMKEVRTFLLIHPVSKLKIILLYDYPWFNAYQQVEP